MLTKERKRYAERRLQVLTLKLKVLEERPWEQKRIRSTKQAIRRWRQILREDESGV